MDKKVGLLIEQHRTFRNYIHCYLELQQFHFLKEKIGHFLFLKMKYIINVILEKYNKFLKNNLIFYKN